MSHCSPAATSSPLRRQHDRRQRRPPGLLPRRQAPVGAGLPLGGVARPGRRRRASAEGRGQAAELGGVALRVELSPRWLRRLRSNRLETAQAEDGTQVPLIEHVEMTAGLAPSLRCGGFDTLAALAAQPPTTTQRRRWLSPEERQRRRSRNRRSRGWDASAAHRACRDDRRVAPSLRCGGFDTLAALAAQPPTTTQRRRWLSPEERQRRRSRNRASRGWDARDRHRACRDDRRVGSQPSLRRFRHARCGWIQPVSATPGGSRARRVVGRGLRRGSPVRRSRGRLFSSMAIAEIAGSPQGQVSALGEVLAQQPVGVLVAAALPR